MARVEDGVMRQRQEGRQAQETRTETKPSDPCPGPDFTRLTLIRLAKRRLV